jgi:hypothetical protein
MSLTITISYPSNKRLFRIPHDIERVRMYVRGDEEEDRRYTGRRDGSVRTSVIDKGDALPEVYRAYPDHQTPLREPFQWMWRGMNPMLSDKTFSSLGGGKLAWTNGTGFDTRHNYILNENVDEQDAAFDAPRFCGGAIVEGVKVNNVVYITSMLTSEPVRNAQDVIDNQSLWYFGTSVNPSGEVNLITRVGFDGLRYPVRIPNLTRLPIYLPADELHELPLGFIPDPRWVT